MTNDDVERMLRTIQQHTYAPHSGSAELILHRVILPAMKTPLCLLGLNTRKVLIPWKSGNARDRTLSQHHEA